jgi:hypothetical protein
VIHTHPRVHPHPHPRASAAYPLPAALNLSCLCSSFRAMVEFPGVPRFRYTWKIDSTTFPSPVRRSLIRNRDCLVRTCRTLPDFPTPIPCCPPSPTGLRTRLIPACSCKTCRRCKDAAVVGCTNPIHPRPGARRKRFIHTPHTFNHPNTNPNTHRMPHPEPGHRTLRRTLRLQNFPNSTSCRGTRYLN